MKEKMNARAFRDCMLAEVKKGLGEGYDTEILKIPQINGGVRDGLRVKKGGENMSPIIITDHYFEVYHRGNIKFEAVVEEILEQYRLGGDMTEAAAEGADCFDSVKDRIVYRLINQSLNNHILSDIPFFEYLDLAIVFYMVNEKNVYEEALVHKRHLEIWGIEKEELLFLARENTPRLNCAQIRILDDVVDELQKHLGIEVPELSFKDFKSPYYVLTNYAGWYGAACILYEGILKYFAERVGMDLVLLPSSIHEFLILPYDPERVNLRGVRDIVESVNAEYVQNMYYLSDEIYLYRREYDKVEMVMEDKGPFN